MLWVYFWMQTIHSLHEGNNTNAYWSCQHKRSPLPQCFWPWKKTLTTMCVQYSVAWEEVDWKCRIKKRGQSLKYIRISTADISNRVSYNITPTQKDTERKAHTYSINWSTCIPLHSRMNEWMLNVVSFARTLSDLGIQMLHKTTENIKKNTIWNETGAALFNVSTKFSCYHQHDCVKCESSPSPNHV